LVREDEPKLLQAGLALLQTEARGGNKPERNVGRYDKLG